MGNIDSSVTCIKCGGKISIDEMQNFVKCPYCETIHSVSDLLKESDAVRIEKIRSKTQTDIADKNMKREAMLEERREQKEKEDAFKKSKSGKLYIVFAAISAFFSVFSFSEGAPLAGIIAVIQTALFILVWLMGMQVVKEKRHNIRFVPAIIAFLLVIPFFLSSNLNDITDKAEKIKWNDMILGTQLPEPENNKGHIYSNTEDTLIIYIEKYTETMYKKYKDDCKNKGYTVDERNDGTDFSAFNDEGYRLELCYSEYSEEIVINLSAPIKLKNIIWPASMLAKKVPVPNSLKGNIIRDNENAFEIYIGGITEAYFNSYCKKCSDSGFSKDYSKSDYSYSAYNSNKDKIRIEYIGNGIMNIYASVSSDTEEKETTTTTASNTASTTAKTTKTTTTAPKKETIDSNGLRPEFKKAMDSYEEFMNEYVEFLENYSSNPVKFAKEYLDYIDKLEQFEKDFEKWDDEELNDAELKYYIEVQSRINQKMVDVS